MSNSRIPDHETTFASGAREPFDTVTSAEISRNFGVWQDRALNGPVVVTRHGRPRVVLLSAEGYATLSENRPRQARDEAMMRMEAAQAAVLNHLAEGFVAMDESFRFRIVNPAYEDLVQRSARQLVGRTVEECFPNASTAPLQQFRRAMISGETIDFETRSVGFHDRIYRVRAFPFPDGVAALVTTRTEDVEGQRRREALEGLEQAVGALPDVAVAKVSVRGTITDANPQFTALTGIPHSSLGGLRLVDVIRPADRHSTLESLETVIRNGQPATLSTTILAHGSTERRARIGLAPLFRDAAVDGLVAVLTPTAEP